MRMNVACVFAAALFLSGCSEDITGGSPSTFGPDNPLDVSGVWRYESTAVKGDCGFLFCGECHHSGTENSESDSWFIRGVRFIEQEGENLTISDHIIDTTMGVNMQGTVRAYSGDFLCGRRFVDESGATLLYTEDGIFHSNDHYESTLALSLSKDGPMCKAIWSITGRRVD